MKKAFIFSIVALLCSLFSIQESFGQPQMKWQGSGNWGPGTQYSRLFDPKTVETISGEVTSVGFITPLKGMSQGVHLVVKTEKGEISVHLGPAWYLQKQDMKLAPKDKVEITGSRITFEGKPTIIASEIKKADGMLKLRDENGFPVWSGWRRRQ